MCTLVEAHVCVGACLCVRACYLSGHDRCLVGGVAVYVCVYVYVYVCVRTHMSVCVCSLLLLLLGHGGGGGCSEGPDELTANEMIHRSLTTLASCCH